MVVAVFRRTDVDTAPSICYPYGKWQIGAMMQDRYAGDIGGFGKFGLLRALADGGFKIGINWYYTNPLESERSPSGAYLNNDGKYHIDEEYDECDPDLCN